MDKCLISVIVPIYNVKKYLSKCLDSMDHWKRKSKKGS